MGAGCSSRGEGIAAAKVAEFDKNNCMKEVKLGDDKDILIVKSEGGFYALGAKCTHLGASLVKGNVANGHVRCPWHGACFNLETGDIEQFPGFDALPCFPVKVKRGSIYVYKTNSFPPSIIRPMSKRISLEPTIAIIGTGVIFHNDRCHGIASEDVIYAGISVGPAAVMCAQTLRQESFSGRIVMITKDSSFPYDRTKLSKTTGIKWDEIKLREPEFFQRYDIEIMLRSPVVRVRFSDRTIEIGDADRSEVHYDRLVIASGLRSRSYGKNIPGGDLKNIVTLYDMEDAKKIMDLSEGKHVLICGSSFIAMELASTLRNRAKHIDIIGRSRSPYGIVLGPTTGKAILTYLLSLPEGNKIRYWGVDEVKLFEGNDKGEVKRALTVKHRAFETQLVVLAIVAVPNTEYLEDTPIRLNQQDGAICVNKFLETSIQGVYAAGDVTQFPSEFSAKGRASICHWGIAVHHGKVVGQNLTGKEMTVHQVVPFFWTAIAGTSIRYTGYGEGHSDTAIFGNLDSMEFCTLYRRSNRTLGIAAVNCDPLAAQMADEFQSGIKYKHDYPVAVLKRFPDPPFIGEKYFGFKDDFAQFTNFDLRNVQTRKSKEIEKQRKKSKSIINLVEF